ncbi:TetR/AcrR family transcriptional regulator [Rhizobium multihospitium]|uniref:Transcriptional regulator, TetR family n=1 Tax=Rhizobium multihospitium TaxID=410764 RepID=A0A1C3XCR7_9HYPH|nr:TetR/AcrR family transcriptional regulator [Rhizobium multihospitium]SCB50090.1 transcriptional regulator, TetR family [Rhizobium multihospitium]
MGTAGRPREFAKDIALEQALVLFWAKGYRSTSIQALSSAMDIDPKSLYAAFGSKEELYLSALDRYAATYDARIWGHMPPGQTPRERVCAVLERAARYLIRTDVTPGGCLITLAALAEETTDRISQIARGHRAYRLGLLRTWLRAAKEQGELRPSADIVDLSLLFFAGFNGITVQARDGANADELTAIANLLIAAWPGR